MLTKVYVDANWKEFADVEVITGLQRKTLLRDDQANRVIAFYQPDAFDLQTMKELAEELLRSPNWQYRDDVKRGPKYFYITGYWTATGHSRENVDKTYKAGKAGKAELTMDDYENLPNSIQMLNKLSGKLIWMLEKYKPKLFQAIQNLPTKKKEDFLFNCFHLFMAPRGESKMHKDIKDAVVVMFVIKMDENCGGELEVGGADACINWKVGDAVLFDSKNYYHGSRSYDGKSERIIGLFIIHREFLRIHGIDPNLVL